MNSDDELLASFVAGTRRADDPQLRELFERRPEVRAQASELAALRGELDAGGALERELIAQARAQTTSADRERVRAALSRPAHARGWRVLPRLAVAAVLVALAGAALYYAGQPGAPAEIEVLNGGAGASIELRNPGAPLAAGVALEWNAPALAPTERFRLQFRARSEGAVGAKLLRQLRCDRASWTPTANDLAGWPAQVELVIARVEADNADRELALSQPFSLRVAR